MAKAQPSGPEPNAKDSATNRGSRRLAIGKLDALSNQRLVQRLSND